jgi:hypothetical protein
MTQTRVERQSTAVPSGKPVIVIEGLCGFPQSLKGNVELFDDKSVLIWRGSARNRLYPDRRTLTECSLGDGVKGCETSGYAYCIRDSDLLPVE